MKKNKPSHMILFIILFAFISFLTQIFFEYINCCISDTKQSIDYKNFNWIAAPIVFLIYSICLHIKRKVFNKS